MVNANLQSKEITPVHRELKPVKESDLGDTIDWWYNGLDDWKTDAIFAQLQRLGVDMDAQRFRDQAAVAKSPGSLDDQWHKQASRDGERDLGRWDDFFCFASGELWERLALDLPCWGSIERRLNIALTAYGEGKPLPPVNRMPATLSAITAMLDYLEALPEAQHREEFDKIRSVDYKFEDWFAEIIDEEGQDPARLEFSLRLANFMEEIATPEGAAAAGTGAAEVLEQLGRRDEAIARARLNIQKYGRSVDALDRAGQLQMRMGNEDEAEKAFLAAIEIAESERDSILAELATLLEKSGRLEELDDLRRRYPTLLPETESQPQATPRVVPSHPRIESPEPIRVGPKIGRNDPCPCGSGKKYKKCCLP